MPSTDSRQGQKWPCFSVYFKRKCSSHLDLMVCRLVGEARKSDFSKASDRPGRIFLPEVVFLALPLRMPILNANLAYGFETDLTYRSPFISFFSCQQQAAQRSN
jgi:hypothetical protein